MLRADVHFGAGLFQELEGPWRDLASHSPNASPFQTIEWNRIWWRHFGGARQPQVHAVYDGKDLVGLMPIMRTHGPWRTLRPMGLGPSDYLHPLARPGLEEDVARVVLESVKTQKGVDLIDLHQVRETRALATCFEGPVLEQATCLVLDLPGSFDAYLQSIGKSLRYDVRKLDKSLFASGRAAIESFGIEEIDRGMEIFFEQHKLRWRKRGLPGAFLGRSIRFHKEWAVSAARNGWLRLSVLSLDKEPIGAIYAMAHGETAYYYQAGFDPAKGSVSPGTLLVAHTIRQSIEEGARHFDFMRGDEPYKRRWKPNHVYRNLRLMAPVSELLGNLGFSWNQMGSRVEGRIRARLEGRGLIG